MELIFMNAIIAANPAVQKFKIPSSDCLGCEAVSVVNDTSTAVGESLPIPAVAAPTHGNSQHVETPAITPTACPLLGALWRSPNRIHQLGTLDRQTKKFRNFHVKDIDVAVSRALALSAEGADAYFACAEFNSPFSRIADNAYGAWGFWVDIDCGESKAAAGNGYATIDDARQALTRFCKEAGLPMPTHEVDSGGGLHVYWALDKFVEREVWQAYAAKFKALNHALNFLADDMRTADIASVLRVPGTLNFKYSPPRPVVLQHVSDTFIEQAGFFAAIDSAHERLCPAILKVTPTTADVSSNQSNHNGMLSTGGRVFTGAEIGALLEQLDPDIEYGNWTKASMAIHHVTGGSDEGLAIFDEWSSRGGKYKGPGEIKNKWRSFKTDRENSYNIGTIINMVKAKGIDWMAVCADAVDPFEKCETTMVYSGQKNHISTVGVVNYTVAPDAAVPVTGNAAGTTTTNTNDAKIAAAYKAVELLMGAVKNDCGAPLEPDAIDALTVIRNHSPADFQRIRIELKKSKGVSITAIDAAIKAKLAEGLSAQTHHGYASNLIASLTVGNYSPIGHEGSLFVVNHADGLWLQKPIEGLARLVAEQHDGKDYCVRKSDYRSIAEHVITLVTDDTFFPEALVGLACPDGFYRVINNAIVVEPLTPAHRQRVKVSFTPTKQDIPMFMAFLHETFQSPTPAEEDQQIVLMQEIAGSILLGIMPKYHKAALLYDPFGRAGKGTIVKIFEVFVPDNFVTAVSPFVWDKEYYLANLAGSRLNVVGELPEDKPIPAAAFKTVTGGDLLSGRHPTHRPISFKNEAAHVFMSNHLINTRDHSEAFFSRWLIVEFPNSRTRSGLPLDPDLPVRIIENELPGIAYWALEGAIRLMSNGAFSKSAVQDRLMAQWRRSTNSVEEFIHESCVVGKEHSTRRSDFYQDYAKWCGENGRKPFNKSRVKDLLQHNIGLGISLAEINGYETFKGVKVKSSFVIPTVAL